MSFLFLSFFVFFYSIGSQGGTVSEPGYPVVQRPFVKSVIIASYLYFRSLKAYRTLKKMGTLQKTAFPWIFSTQKRW